MASSNHRTPPGSADECVQHLINLTEGVQLRNEQLDSVIAEAKEKVHAHYRLRDAQLDKEVAEIKKRINETLQLRSAHIDREVAETKERVNEMYRRFQQEQKEQKEKREADARVAKEESENPYLLLRGYEKWSAGVEAAMAKMSAEAEAKRRAIRVARGGRVYEFADIVTKPKRLRGEKFNLQAILFNDRELREILDQL